MTEPVAVIAVALIAAGAVAFVALPFLRRPTQRREPEQEPSSGLALLERRDRALAALKELEFEHRTGKISDIDYVALLGPLRRDASEALQLIKAARPHPVGPTRAAKEARRRKRAVVEEQR